MTSAVAATFPQVLQTYALLQIAAEAYLGTTDRNDPAAPTSTGPIDLTAAMLTKGNTHSSKMTAQQAEQFSLEWKVLSHQPNTATGFSATLFVYIGEPDSARGVFPGQMVVSFRSTEFIDDQARDSKATNELEIKEGGWAFGQIADMQKWWSSVASQVGSAQVDVTGYSLGGHLATAFYELHSSQINKVYTFNGAGVGKLDSGVSLESLIAGFEQHRTKGANADYFTNADALALYQALSVKYSENKPLTTAGVRADLNNVSAVLTMFGTERGDSVIVRQLKLLASALDRIAQVSSQIDDMASIRPSVGDAPAQITGTSNVEALRLDYQLAALRAMNRSSSYRSNLIAGLFTAYFGKSLKSGVARDSFFDIVGNAGPSAVANSQYHYGIETGVFIEEQPLWRGSAVSEAALATYRATFETRLLLNQYDLNDFGDEHSIVLIEDSLRVQSALARLTPSIGADAASVGTFAPLFRAATKAAGSKGSANSGQGTAEGDAVENLLDSARRVLLGPNINPTLTDAQRIEALKGNTWYLAAPKDPALRDALETSVNAFVAATESLKNQLRFNLPSASMDGRRDFASFLSLYTLSTVRISGASPEGQVKLDVFLQGKWAGLYQQWQTDQSLPNEKRTFTDAWLAARGDLLAALTQANLRNEDDVSMPVGRSSAGTLVDLTSNRTVRLQGGNGIEVRFGTAQGELLQVTQGGRGKFFGGDGNDSLIGAQIADYLEGGGGNDELNGQGGSDVLLGGDGNDTLDGGDNAADRLIGGSGFDTYIFQGSWGSDTVLDADGDGRLSVEGFGAGLPDGKLEYGTSNVYWSADRSVRYLLEKGSNGTNTLFISIVGKSGSIRIEDWSPAKNLGITLTDSATPPPTTRHAVGDVQKLVDEQGKLVTGGEFGYATGAVVSAQDIQNGNAAADELSGGLDNDGLAGQDGDDLLNGGAGDDLLIGGLGSDVLQGGSGNDVIIGGETRFQIYANDPSYYLTQLGTPQYDLALSATLPTGVINGMKLHSAGFSWGVEQTVAQRVKADGGSSFNGVKVWTTNGSVSAEGDLFGFAGLPGEADTKGNVIDAGEGNDIVFAGEGDDVVDGGDGDDDVMGMGGNDVISGGAGVDILWGDGITKPNQIGYTTTFGSDTLMGGDGNDHLAGQGGGDALYGDDGDDVIRGDVVADPDNPGLSLTPAADHGNDLLDGGAGDDTMTADGGDDTLIGGTGNDLMRGDAKSSSVPEALHGYDYLDGGDGDDQLIGGGKDDTLLGGAGSDSLWGDDSTADLQSSAHGNDWLDAGAGNDFLKGGSGNDTLLGGDGDDQLEGDEGLSDAETALSGDDYLDGGAGNDNLFGNAGNDVVEGGDGSDTLHGGVGDDTLIGGAGADYLAGGAGNDTYVISVADLELSPTGASETLIDDQGINKVIITGGTPTAVQVVSGQLIISFGAGQQFSIANGGAGVVSSFEINGTTYSYGSLIAAFQPSVETYTNTQTGTKTVIGGKGVDSLNGYGGKTVFFGGDGSDVMRGDGGQNTYVIGLGSGQKRIIDTSNKLDAQGNRLVNRVRFEDGITANNVLLTNEGGLTLYVGSPEQSVQIEGGDLGDASAQTPIDEFEFSDGTVLTFAQLLAKGLEAIGTEGDDLQLGTAFVDRFYATTGNDTLKGGAGADVYEWGLGSGEDVVEDSATALDVDEVWVGADIAAGQLMFGRSGDDLLIRVRDGVDSLRITNHFTTGAIELLKFADGTTLSAAEIALRITNELTDAADIFNGTEGDDFIDSKGGNDVVRGKDGNDQIMGGTGNDTLYGDVGNDLLIGGNGSDSLIGAEGRDTLDGRGDGAWDMLDGGDGADVYLFGRGSGADQISDLGSDNGLDVIRLGAGIAPADITFDITLAYSPMRLRIVGTEDVISFWGPSWGQPTRGVEQIEFADGTVWTRQDYLNRYFAAQATSGNDTINGYETPDSIVGGAGDDRLLGDAGNDTLDGGTGTDTLTGGAGNDLLTNGKWMHGSEGDDTYLVTTWNGFTINDQASDAVSSADRLKLVGITPDMVSLGRPFWDNDQLLINVKGQATAIAVEDQYNDRAIEYIEFADGTVWNLADMRARDRNVAITIGNDFIKGFRTNDSLDGLSGDDKIGGYQGDDTLLGGAGDDTLSGDNMFVDPYMGSASPTDGNDLLDGGAGNDALNGGGGNDTYVFGYGRDFDTVIEQGGTDTVRLVAGIAPQDVDLARVGSDLYVVVGRGRDQLVISGHFGDETRRLERIEFADGTVWDLAAITARVPVTTADTLTGGAGNDNFVVDSRDDLVIEGANQGVDSVISSVGYTLGSNVENLTLSGFLSVGGAGNSLANVITGNTGDNYLSGGDGADTLVGGVGNDTLSGDEGYDLDHAVDSMSGGAGDDTYYVTIGDGDIVVEQTNEGHDTVLLEAGGTGYADFQLAANVEDLLLRPMQNTGIGIDGLRLVGNSRDNLIQVDTNAYSDTRIDGGAGADTMIGSQFGNTFVVDNIGDVVRLGGVWDPANPSTVIDTVESSVDFTLGAGIERLQLTGTAKKGVGNELNNVLGSSNAGARLEGLGGNDTLYGVIGIPGMPQTAYFGGGTDTLVGGVGDDTYHVEWEPDVRDQVIELAGEGYDTVITGGAGQTFDIAQNFANIEALDVSGNNNTLIGDDADNHLIARGHTSVLRGGAGNDLIEVIGGSNTYVTFSQLFGGDGNDTLVGGERTTLDGGTGDDLLSGVYNGTVVFDRGSGQDTWTGEVGEYSSSTLRLGAGLTLADLQLSRNGTALILSFGAGDAMTIANYFASEGGSVTNQVLKQVLLADGTSLSPDALLHRLQAGNINQSTEAADALFGSAGADSLSGAGGDDWMFGDAGNDQLDGGSGNDTVLGGAGDDFLDGGAGNDWLAGGAGSNTYSFGRGDGQDTIASGAQAGSVNTLRLKAGILPSDIVMSRGSFIAGDPSDSALTLTINGTQDQVVISRFFVDEDINNVDNPLTRIEFADGTVWTRAQFASMARLLTGTAGNDTLSGSVDPDRLIGLAGNDSLLGNADDDTLDGGIGDDTLDGGAGDDKLIGGAGNDTYIVDSGADQVVESAGDGADTIRTSLNNLSLVANVENLTLLGSSNLIATGNELANALSGNTGANKLFGLDGNDTLDGGNGNGNDTLDGGLGDDSLIGGAGVDSLLGGAGNDTLDGGAGIDRLAVSDGNDTYVVDDIAELVADDIDLGTDTVQSSINWTLGYWQENLTLTGSTATNATGNWAANMLRGNGGGNVIDGQSGDDTLQGGAGNDTLSGGAGNDVYIFNRGDGADRILERDVSDFSSRDVLRFGTGITSEEIHAINVRNPDGTSYVKLSLAGGTDSVRIDFTYSNDPWLAVEFADGTVWSKADLVNRVLRDAATAGNDTLVGDEGANLLIGGKGDDALEGGGGDDAYQFSSGDGYDSIFDLNGKTTIRFDASVRPQDVDLQQFAIRYGAQDRVSFTHYLTDVWMSVDRIEFADGTVWTGDQLKIAVGMGTRYDDAISGGSAAESFQGKAGDDSVFAEAGDDTLNGGAGRDYLSGDAGSDTYLYNCGDGSDQIGEAVDQAGDVDVLKFGPGVLPSDVTMSKWGTSALLIIRASGQPNETIVVGSWFDTPSRRLERVEFADGTVWQAAQFAIEFARAVPTDFDDLLQGTGNADQIDGGMGNDTLIGLGGNDSLTGGADHDQLTGGLGNDTLSGGAGSDTYYFHAGDGDDVIENRGDGIYADNLAFDSSVSINDIELRTDATSSDLQLFNRLTGQTITVKGWFVDEASRLTQVQFVDGSWDAAYITGRFVGATTGDDQLTGGGGADTIDGLDGNDVISGAGGNDSIIGGLGSDSLSGEDGNDSLVGGSGVDWLMGGGGDDSLNGGADDDVLFGESGNDTFVIGPNEGRDRIIEDWGVPGETTTVQLKELAPSGLRISRDAYSLYLVRAGSNDVVILANWYSHDDGAPADGVAATSGVLVKFDDGTVWTAADLNSRLNASVTSAFNDAWFGSAANDIVDAGEGDDLLNGRLGNDVLRGGSGNDEINGDEGTNLLEGGAGNDYLYTQGGAQVAIGGVGDDEIDLYETTQGQLVLFNAGDGNDTVWLGDKDSAADVLSVGGAVLANLKLSSSDGRAVTIHIGTGSSITLENANKSGVDLRSVKLQLISAGSVAMYDLTAVIQEFLAAYASNPEVGQWAAQASLTSHGLGTSSTSAIGGRIAYRYAIDGNLSSFSDSTLQSLIGAANFGVVAQSISSTITGTTGNDNLVGTASADRLEGLAGADTLNGGAGDDTLVGGAGDDIYVVDSPADVVTELASEGTDTVQSSVTFTLPTNVEKLTLTGVAAINATGNTLNNVLTGNSGANTLDGGTGNDTMIGGAGDDIYVFDATGDVVTENASEGVDLVRSGVTYTLGSNVENLTLTGSSVINGTGNSLDNQVTGNGANNTLTGGAGNDTLDGGLGNDTMVGGTGNDTYVVNVSTDVVTENASEGTDTIESSITLTLASNVENLTLTGTSAIDGTGNTLANLLKGNSGKNTLNGGTGNDTMQGGAGDDTYVVDAIGDSVVELTGEGIDLVQSSVTYTLSANVENLTLSGTSGLSGTGNVLDNLLTGNSGANTLTGGAGNDTLNGGTGKDTLVGGQGNDVYMLDVTTDVVTELAGEGTDTVQIGLTYTLGGNVENLLLTGSSTISGTGNGLDNLLTGNSANNTLTGAAGNDTLDGGLGNDTMVGGTGNDVYVVNVSTDVVTENASEGTDTVQSAVTYTLGSNLENLTLTGSAAINGSGNTVDNFLTGNSGANSLTGAAGADTLDGGAGNDTLIGGTGADTYRFGIGYGLDTIQENDATAGVKDVVAFANGIAQGDIQFTRSGNDLNVSIRNTTDKLVVTGWYLGTQYQVEEFRFGDGSVIVASQAQSLVGAMAAFGGNTASIMSSGGASSSRRENMMLDMLSVSAV